MSEMKLIMEKWRRFEKEVQIPLQFQEGLDETPVFLFEGKSKKHSSTMTFGNLFENLENNKITITEALKVWEKSTFYEMKVASSPKGQQVLEELIYEKRGWEKEAERQDAEERGEAGEVAPENKPSAKKKLLFKATVVGNKIIMQAIGKGMRFQKWLDQKMASGAKIVLRIIGGKNPEESKLLAVCKKLGSIFMKVVKTMAKIFGTLIKKYSSVMSRGDVKLAIMALCLGILTLSVWFPMFAVAAPFAMRKTTRTAGMAAVKKGVKTVAKKIRDKKQTAAAMAESIQRKLMEVLEDLDVFNDIKEIQNAIGQAIIQLAEEVGDTRAAFTTDSTTIQAISKTDIGGVQTDDYGIYQTYVAETASETDENAKNSMDAIWQLQNALKGVDAAENKKEALKALEYLDKASADGTDKSALIAKKALQFGEKLCGIEPEFCSAQLQLARDINTLSDSDVATESSDFIEVWSKMASEDGVTVQDDESITQGWGSRSHQDVEDYIDPEDRDKFADLPEKGAKTGKGTKLSVYDQKTGDISGAKTDYQTIKRTKSR
jgi:uncharacterized protein with ATP-grasp and redox domains